MRVQSGNPAMRAFAAVVVGIGIAGCSDTAAPEAPVNSAAPPPPLAASPAKSQKAEPARAEPASASAVLAAAVKAALAADARLKSFAIDIRAASGSVELFGTVDSKQSREKAEKIAAAVDGVTSVKNHLVLVSGS